MKKILIICLIAFLTYGFFFQKPMSPEAKLLYSTIRWHTNQFGQSENLRCSGRGGAIPAKIESFMIEYDSNQYMEIPEVRKLLVKMTQALIHKVNASPENAHLFGQFPIGPKQSDISIAFRDKDYKRAPLPYVALAFISNDRISYATGNLENRGLTTMFEEPYDEAVRIVEKAVADDE